MSVIALLSDISGDEFKKFREAKLYTTFNFIQDHPLLEQIKVYSDENLVIDIGRDWLMIHDVFKVKGSALKYIIEGDYHHPAGIDNGIDAGGYLYEGFVTPDTVKSISSLLDGYPSKAIISELKAHDLVFNVDYDEKELNHFQMLFDFYREVANRDNAIATLLS